MNMNDKGKPLFYGFVIYISPHDYKEEYCDNLRRCVLKLGGTLSPTLRKDINCMILDSVKNPDYETIRPILKNDKSTLRLVSSKWLRDCWVMENKQEVVQKIENYLLPCFAGLTFSSTGFSEPAQKEMIAHILKNGGKFNFQLIKGEATHLICETTTSAKYQTAKDWGNVKMVSKQWIDDCILQKKCLNEKRYFPHEDDDPSEKKKVSSNSINQLIVSNVYANDENDQNLLNKRSRTESVDDEGQSQDENRKKKTRSLSISDSKPTKRSTIGQSSINVMKDRSAIKTLLNGVQAGNLPSITAGFRSKNIFQGVSFVLIGFPSEVESYLVSCIVLAGGDVSHIITPYVQFVALGPNSNASIRREVDSLPFEIPIVDLFWFLENLFEPSEWMVLIPTS